MHFLQTPSRTPASSCLCTDDAMRAKSKLYLVLCNGFHIIQRYISTQLHFKENAEPFPLYTGIDNQ